MPINSFCELALRFITCYGWGRAVGNQFFKKGVHHEWKLTSCLKFPLSPSLVAWNARACLDNSLTAHLLIFCFASNGFLLLLIGMSTWVSFGCKSMSCAAKMLKEFAFFVFISAFHVIPVMDTITRQTAGKAVCLIQCGTVFQNRFVTREFFQYWLIRSHRHQKNVFVAQLDHC